MNQVGSGSESGISDWVKAHAELTALARRRAVHDWEEGGLMLQALRTEAHRHLGFGGFAEYVERLFGYSPRATEEKLRVARALENLPDTDRALRDGELNWSAARELTRVTAPETEKAWLSAARQKTVRDLERLVSGRKPGDLPTDPVRPEAKRVVLRFEVTAATAATFREAVAALRRKSDGPLDDEALLLLLAREVLQGPGDDGRSSYQIAITTCEDCQQGFQQAAGELVAIEPEFLAAAECDAQRLGHLDAHASPHVGSASHAQNTPSVSRASQTIPPAVRRRVLRRDRGCCVVSGCRHSTFVDVHHLELRSKGGTHEGDNLVVLCAAHHRAVHRGQLIIEGTVSTGLRFRHPDGRPYGDSASATDSESLEKAYLGLRGLGFSERDCRRALEEARDRREPSSIEELLRASIELLT